MSIIEEIKELLKSPFVLKAIKISLPIVTGIAGVSIELESKKTIDERISRLGEIKEDLKGAIKAVDELQNEALKRKNELNNLQESLAKQHLKVELEE